MFEMLNVVEEYSGFFAAFGVLSLSYIALRALYTVWRGLKSYLLSRLIGLGVDVKFLGEWAVVTGATDGIGKAYATEVARRGMNVVLISRSIEKLQAVAQEIESTSSVKTKCIQVDFGGGLEIYDTLSSDLAGLEIGLLVNNVGASYDSPTYFNDLKDNEEIRKIIHINCCSVTFMTRIVLPQMLERKKGAIINLSSLTGVIPTPLLTVYSGSKAYVDYFSRCLQAEYKNSGVIIQSILPAFVTTKMSKMRRATWMIPNPETYVHSALATLGVAARTPGYLAHGLQWLVSSTVQEPLYMWLAIKMMLDFNKRALKKLQKTQ